MKNYQSFEDIEKDLTRLKLERNIALEEMKLLKSEFKDDLKPANWVSTIFNVAGKYGFYVLLKRFFK
ncbi:MULTISPECIES: DUF6327 family protein [Corallibacter]|uniref:Glutaminyl-tRNA synthetase n=1 Tax=Corallibacter vietnamensis TaxID=904130 RepID=A0ABP7H3I1_9FLAO